MMKNTLFAMLLIAGCFAEQSNTQITRAVTPQPCEDLGGASQECADRPDCQAIINSEGAQVCVAATPPPLLKPCEALGGTSQECSDRVDCRSIIRDGGAQVCEPVTAPLCETLSGTSQACTERTDCRVVYDSAGAPLCMGIE